VPGTSCQATIAPSLRDKSHSPVRGPRIKLALVGLKPWAESSGPLGQKVAFKFRITKVGLEEDAPFFRPARQRRARARARARALMLVLVVVLVVGFFPVVRAKFPPLALSDHDEDDDEHE
jgi:hypothetical protein